MDIIDDELTPEQRLAAIIINAHDGAYAFNVFEYQRKEIERINFKSLQRPFDDYVKAKTSPPPADS